MTLRKYGDAATYAKVRKVKSEVAKLKARGLLDKNLDVTNLKIQVLKSGEVRAASRAIRLTADQFAPVLREPGARVYRLTKQQQAALREGYADRPDQTPLIKRGRVVVSKGQAVSRKTKTVTIDGKKVRLPDVSIVQAGTSKAKLVKIDDKLLERIEAFMQKHPGAYVGFQFEENGAGTVYHYTNDPDFLYDFIMSYRTGEPSQIQRVLLVTEDQVARRTAAERREGTRTPARRPRRAPDTEARREAHRAAQERYRRSKQSRGKA